MDIVKTDVQISVENIENIVKEASKILTKQYVYQLRIAKRRQDLDVTGEYKEQNEAELDNIKAQIESMREKRRNIKRGLGSENNRPNKKKLEQLQKLANSLLEEAKGAKAVILDKKDLSGISDAKIQKLGDTLNKAVNELQSLPSAQLKELPSQKTSSATAKTVKAIERLGTSFGKRREKNYGFNRPEVGTKPGTVNPITKAFREGTKRVKNQNIKMTTSHSGKYISPVDVGGDAKAQKEFLEAISDAVYYDLETVGQIGSSNKETGIRPTQISMTKRQKNGSIKTADGFIKLSKEVSIRLNNALKRVKSGEGITADEQRELLSFANIRIRDKQVVLGGNHSFDQNFVLSAATNPEVLKDISRGLEIMSGTMEKDLKNLYSEYKDAYNATLKAVTGGKGLEAGTKRIGHKSLGFDDYVSALYDVGSPIDSVIDTLSLARQYLDLTATNKVNGKEVRLKGYGLDDFAQFFGVEIDEEKRHSAGYDTELNRDIALKLVEYIQKKLPESKEASEKLRRGVSIEPGKMGVATSGYWKENNTSFRREKGKNGRYSLATGKFGDWLLKENEAYTYNGLIANGDGTYTAQLTGASTQDEVYLTGSIEQIQQTFSRVFGEGFQDQVDTKKVAKDVVADLFKPGANSFSRTKRMLDDKSSPQRAFLEKELPEALKFLENAVKTVEATYTGESAEALTMRQTAWEALGAQRGIVRGNRESVNGLDALITEGAEHTFTGLKQAYLNFIEAHFKDDVRDQMVEALNDESWAKKNPDSKIISGEIKTPFYNMGAMIFDALKADDPENILGKISRPTSIKDDAFDLKQDELQEIVSKTLTKVNPKQIADKISSINSAKGRAFTGAYAKDRLKSFGYTDEKVIDQLTSKNSTGRIESLQGTLEEIVSEANKNGLNTEIAITPDGDIQLGFYPAQDYSNTHNANGEALWEKMSQVTIGLADEQGVVKVGGLAKTNYGIMKADEQGEAYQITAMEQQAQNILRVIKSQKFVQEKLIDGGDVKGFTGVLNRAARDAFSSASTAFPGKVTDDVSEMSQIGTSESQRRFRESAIAWMPYLEDILSKAVSESGENDELFSNAIRGDEKSNWYNLVQDMLQIVTVLNSGAIEQGTAELSEVQKALLNNPVINEALSKVAKQVRFTYQSTKEEQVYSGGITHQMGSGDIEWAGWARDEASRATSQGYNNLAEYAIDDAGKAVKEAVGRASNFAKGNINSDAVDRMTMRLGYVNDAIIAQVRKELIEKLVKEGKTQEEAQKMVSLFSVEEGGSILFEDTAEALQGYYTQKYEIEAQVVGKEIEQLTKDIKEGDSIERAVEAGILYLGKNKKGEDIWAHTGDKVKITKGADGLYGVNVSRKVGVEEGTKLVGGGNRVTVSGIIGKDLKGKFLETLNSVTGKDYSGVNMLVEDTKVKASNLGDLLQGRMAYFINTYIEKNKDRLGGEAEAREEAVRIIKDKIGGKEGIGEFKELFAKMFEFKNGKITEGVLTQEEQDKLLSDTGFVDLFGENSYLSQAGKALLGDDWEVIAATAVTDTMMNLANNEFPYHEGVGDIPASQRESLHRVKLGRKELNAISRLAGIANINDPTGEQGQALEQLLVDLQARQSEATKAKIEEGKRVAALMRDSLNGATEILQGDLVIKRGQDFVDTEEMQLAAESFGTKISEFVKGGITPLDYENTPMGIINRVLGEKGLDRAVLDLSDMNVVRNLDNGNTVKLNAISIPKIDPKQIEDIYMLDEINKATSSLMKAVNDKSGTKEEIDSRVQTAVNEYLKAVRNVLLDKDGEYMTAMTQITPPNASAMRAIGINRSSEVDDSYQNMAIISAQQATEMLLSSGLEKENSENDTKRQVHLQELLALADSLKLQVSDKQREKIDKWAGTKKTYDEFQKQEKELIDQIVEAVTFNGDFSKKQEKYLTAFAHRYPSIDGLDERLAKIAVVRNGTNGTVRMGQGLLETIKGDVDGDKIRLWLGLGGNKGNSFDKELFEKTEKAKKNLEQIQSIVAVQVARGSRGENNAELNFGASVAAKDVESLQKSLKSRKFTGLMSKFNKENIGSLSNSASGIRDLLYNAGLDERGIVAGDYESMRNAAYTELFRMIFEQFEQDSISSKKISARLVAYASKVGKEKGQEDTAENREKIIMDEIQQLADLIKGGNYKEALERGFNLGIFDEDGLSTAKARTTLNFIGTAFGDTGRKILDSLGTSFVEEENGRGYYTGISKKGLFQVIEELPTRFQNKTGKDMRYQPRNNNIANLTRNYGSWRFGEGLDLMAQGMPRANTLTDNFINDKQFTGEWLEQARYIKGNSGGEDIIAEAFKKNLAQKLPGMDDKQKYRLAVELTGIDFAGDEVSAIKALNEVLGVDHVEAVERATQAEAEKMAMSKNLVGQLGKEGNAANNATNALESHGKKLHSITGFIPNYWEDDKGRHHYQNPITGEEGYSVTTLKGFGLHGLNPTFEKDIEAIEKAAAGRTTPLTPADVGMDENSNDFNFMTSIIASGIRGDLFHAWVDKMTSAGLDSLDQLDEETRKEYENAKAEALKQLSVYGFDDSYLSMDSRLDSYFAAKKQMGLDPKASLSEQHLGMVLKGELGEYTVGGTLDQLFAGTGMFALLDSKTGNVKGLESIQLTLLKMLIEANKDKFDALKDVDLSNIIPYIADIGDGKTKMVQYDFLSNDQAYEFVARAYAVAEGRAEPYSKEEANRLFNTQRKTGAYYGYSKDYTAPNNGADSVNRVNEQKLIKESLAQREKVIKVQDALYQAEDRLNDLRTSGGLDSEIAETEAYVAALKEQLKVEIEIYKYKGLEKKTIEATGKKGEKYLKAIIGGHRQKNKDGKIEIVGGVELSEEGSKFYDISQRALDAQRGVRATKPSRRKPTSSKANTDFIKKSDINNYLNALKRQGEIERDIQRLQLKGRGLNGNAALENQAAINALNSQRNALQPTLESYQVKGDQHLLNGKLITDQETINNLETRRSQILEQNRMAMERLNISASTHVGVVDRIKNSYSRVWDEMGDYLVSYLSFDRIRQSLQQLVQTATQLDSAMVDLQIASGNTRRQVRGMMSDFAELGMEIGRSTIEVANAANDWLRAGYSANDVTELTRNSMNLSTLGMISSADATSYLISMLKGWKLEVSEISSVVDKLTTLDFSAAISAGDLALAASRASNSAQMSGSNMDRYLGMLTTVADVTQAAPQSVGEGFKTLYARYQNVAAGKFAASQAEMESENYNEEEWTSLNDVEKALGSLGINIRTSVDKFKSFDDTMDEIAANWNTYSDVQKAAIASSMAGVRQREKFVTLMNNWDSVLRFEQISANSYGTAMEKMEAYTTSLQAANQRLTVAMEQAALALKIDDILTWFKNELSFVIENLGAFSAGLIGAMLLLDGGKGFFGAKNIATRIGGAAISYGNLFDKERKTNRAQAVHSGGFISDVVDSQVDNYMSIQRQKYSEALAASVESMAGLDEARHKQLTWINRAIEKSALNTDAEGKLAISEALLAGAQGNLSTVYRESTQQETIKNLGMSVYNQLSEEHQKAITENIMSSKDYDGQIDDTKRALATLEYVTLEAANGTEGLDPESKRHIQEAAKRTRGLADEEKNARKNTQTAMIKGLFSMGGGALGFFGTSALGEIIGEKTGNEKLGDSISAIGTMIGPVIGSAVAGKIPEMAKSVGTAFKTGGMQGLVSLFANPSSILSAIGVGGLVAMAVGAVYNIIKQQQAEHLEEIKNDFKEATNELTEIETTGASVAEYDKLAQGVNRFGKNMTLTNEDYNRFLEISNQLAEKFPDLVSYIDESGNKFLGTAGAIGNMTEKINEAIEAQRELVDAKLLDPDLLKDSFKQAKKAYEEDEIIKDLEKNRRLAEGEDGYAIGSNYTYKDLAENEQIRENYKFTAMATVFENMPGAEEKAENLIQNYIDQYNEAVKATEKGEKEIYSIRAKYASLLSSESQGILKRSGILADVEQMTEAEQGAFNTIMNQYLSNMDLSELGDVKNYEKYVKEYGEKAKKMVQDEMTGQIMIRYNYDMEETENVGDVENARNKLLSAIKQAFGGTDAELTDDERNMIKILWGFEYAGDGNFTDTQNYYDNFVAALGGKTNIDREIFNEYSESDSKKAITWANKGYIDRTTDDYQLRRMLYYNSEPESADLKLSKISSSLNAYGYAVDSRGGSNKGEKFRIKVADTIRNGLKEDITKEDIATDFAEFGPAVWEAIYTSIEKGKEQGYDNEDIIAETLKIDATAQSEYLKQIGEVIVSGYDDIFGAGTLEIEGVVDSWNELKNVLEAVANTYDMVAEAQEEQNKYGKLSWKTTLDLLTANDRYIDALVVKDGKIQLASNAQEIMTQVEIEAAKATIENMIATNEQTIAQLDNEIQTLKSIAAGEDATDETRKQIEQTVKDLSDKGKAYTAVYNIAMKLNNLESGRDINEGLETWADTTMSEKTYTGTKMTRGEAYRKSVEKQIEQTRLENSNEVLRALQENLDDPESFRANYWSGGKRPGDDDGGTEKAKAPYRSNRDTLEEARKLLEAYDSLIDKEWEAMKAFDNSTETEYFIKKTKSYQDQLANVRDSIIANQNELKRYEELGADAFYPEELLESDGKTRKSDAEITDMLETKKNELREKGLSLLSDEEQLEKRLRNLDDEKVEDNIRILGLLGGSVQAQIRLQQELIKTNDEDEERIERQKELNKLLQKELELRREVNDWQISLIDRDLKYVTDRGNINNKEYGDLIGQRLLKRTQNEEFLQTSIDRYIEEARESYKKAGITGDEVERLVWEGDNEASIKLRETVSKLIESQDETRTWFVDVWKTYAEGLERQYAEIEQARPDQWFFKDDIVESYTSANDVLEQELNAYLQILDNAKDLTDETIEEITEAYNNALLKMKQNEIKMHQDLDNLYNSQYEAIVYRINLYKEEIQDAMDKINDDYDDQLKKLQDANDERDRAIELEDLLINKRNAAREKERVYRQGIGWVYESPRDKQKEAQRDLDRFYDDDYINDLGKTRDDELKVLQDRMEAWDLYLKNLEWNMKEFERLQNLRILEELMNADSEQEIRNRITSDMETFNSNISEHYKNYNTIFYNDLIEPYRENLITLQGLMEEFNNLINAQDFLGLNNAMGEMGAFQKYGSGDYGVNGTTYKGSVDRYVTDFEVNDKGYVSNRQYGEIYEQAMKEYASTGSAEAKKKMDEAREAAKKQEQDLKAQGKWDDSWKTVEDRAYETSKEIQENKDGYKHFHEKLAKYAGGLEEGPVTYTGLAMLHGTPSSPEYVLNSDQAYNILRNMATTQLPETSKPCEGEGTTQYIVQGDVVLENCDDPALFWSQVTTAMGNRWSVTKNNK